MLYKLTKWLHAALLVMQFEVSARPITKCDKVLQSILQPVIVFAQTWVNCIKKANFHIKV